MLVMAMVADFFIPVNLRKSTAQKLIGWNEIYSGNLQSDLVIMGGSRAWVQYSPRILDSILNINSYNLGIDGSTINRQIIKYNAYRRWNTKPKVIVQNIDFLTLYIRTGYQKEQFFPYFFDDSLRTEISRYEKLNVLQKYFPAYRYAGSTDLILIGLGIRIPQKDMLVKGYCGKNDLWDGTQLAKLKEISYEQDSHALLIFDKYLAKACSENIRVIFVYAPLYFKASEKIINMEGMYQMYDSIARKYNIPILDYNYDLISYDTACFYNATHLNRKGAELFSVKLAHAIDSLGILKQ